MHIPVVWEVPKDSDLDQFFEVMDLHRERKIFVHCVVNWRVSSFVYLHRVIRQGIPMEVAGQSLHKIWMPDPVWRRFIDRSLARYAVPD